VGPQVQKAAYSVLGQHLRNPTTLTICVAGPHDQPADRASEEPPGPQHHRFPGGAGCRVPPVAAVALHGWRRHKHLPIHRLAEPLCFHRVSVVQMLQGYCSAAEAADKQLSRTVCQDAQLSYYSGVNQAMLCGPSRETSLQCLQHRVNPVHKPVRCHCHIVPCHSATIPASNADQIMLYLYPQVSSSGVQLHHTVVSYLSLLKTFRTQ
jgi:hypothetical protein